MQDEDFPLNLVLN